MQAARDIVCEEFDRSYKGVTNEEAMQIDRDDTVSILITKTEFSIHLPFSHPSLQRTSLTISLILLPRQQTTVMNLNVILPLMLKMLKTRCCGGMRGVIDSLASHAWPAITCLFLVSDDVLSSSVSEFSFQILPLTLNVSSAKAALCSHTSAIVFLFNPQC
jgi:hypothetical protein